MRLTEIYVHPLKSCRGNLVQQALVEPMGLQFDRRWMLIDEKASFLTGRDHPRLVLINVAADEAGATFRAPGMEPLRVDIAELRDAERVQVWRSLFGARVGADEADFWFSEYLGINCRLAYIGSETTRRTNADPGVPMGFADGYPVLLIGTASLAALNARLDTPVTMRHFRPNLVVETSEPHIEDTWRHIQIGAVKFENLKPCARCIFTTVDPDTATFDAGKQPLDMLNRYRRQDAGTMFGINLAARSLGTLMVGDTLTAR